jgi:hypothetical protein
VQDLVAEKATGAASLADFVAKLAAAAGDLADGARRGRRQHARRPVCRISRGRHRDRRRQLELRRRHPPREGARGKGIHYVDVGTSGGVWGSSAAIA